MTPGPKPRIAVINASLGGKSGNTGAALDRMLRTLAPRADLTELVLRDQASPESWWPVIESVQGFVFATGTYWDSWSSLLQRFFEEATELEAGPAWLGKPVAALVTMHSVGGKEVLSRLQGVLGTLGCVIPPMSGMVYSLANQLALQAPSTDFQRDLWQVQDLEVIAHNLLEALGERRSWRAWPVDAGDARRRWFSD